MSKKPYAVPSLDDEVAECTRNYLVFLMRWTGGEVGEAAILAGRDRRAFDKLLEHFRVQPLAYRWKSGPVDKAPPMQRRPVVKERKTQGASRAQRILVLLQSGEYGTNEIHQRLGVP